MDKYQSYLISLEIIGQLRYLRLGNIWLEAVESDLRLEKDNSSAQMEKAASYRAELAVARANEVKLKEVNTQLTGKLQNSENKQLVQLNEILEESFPTLG